MTSSTRRFWSRASKSSPCIPMGHGFFRSCTSATDAIANIYSALEPRKIRAPNHTIMMTSSTRRFRSRASKSSPCIPMGDRFFRSCSSATHAIANIYSALEPRKIRAPIHTIMMTSSTRHFRSRASKSSPCIPMGDRFFCSCTSATHAIANIYSELEPREIRAPNHAIMMTSSTRRFRSSASKSSPCISMGNRLFRSCSSATHAIANIYSALEPRKIRAPNHAIMMMSSTRRFRSRASKSSPCISMGNRFFRSCSPATHAIANIYSALEPHKIWAPNHAIMMTSSTR